MNVTVPVVTETETGWLIEGYWCGVEIHTPEPLSREAFENYARLLGL